MYRTLQNTAEHFRTFFQNIFQNTEQVFVKMVSLSYPRAYAIPSTPSSSRKMVDVPATGHLSARRGNLKYHRAFPYVDDQRVGMLGPNQIEPI